MLSKKIIIFLFIGVVLLVGAFFIKNYLQNRGFKVLSVQPSSQKVSTLTPYFEITLNKAPSSDNIRVQATPNIVSGHSVDGKQLRIYLKTPMIENSQYKIFFTVFNGSLRIDDTVVFKPQRISFYKLPKEQQKYLTDHQDEGSITDPILAHLPYGSLDFSLVPNFNNNTLVLDANILLSRADTGSGPAVKNQTIKQYKDEVIKYIESVGLNPSKYTIKYQIVERP